MRAVVLRRTGGPEVLELEEAPRPEPGDGEVLIEVTAVSVNPIEYKQRRGGVGKELPAILGSDVAGRVVESRLDSHREGDEVFGLARSGGYAEYAVLTERTVAAKPQALADEVAAALPVAGLTAWQALFDRGGLERGSTLLVAGASGGVGHLAVQLGRHAGARVIGTASGRNRDFVLGLGADEFVDYTQQDVAAAVRDVDVVFDTVGGEGTERLLPVLRPGGILVTIAGAAPEEAARERGVRAELMIMSPDPTQLARLGELTAEGELEVEIAERIPLEEIRRAHELSESGRTRGKIVLLVGG